MFSSQGQASDRWLAGEGTAFAGVGVCGNAYQGRPAQREPFRGTDSLSSAAAGKRRRRVVT